MLKNFLQKTTKQKKIEFNLQVFAELVNVLNEAMLICEPGGNIIYVNNHATEIYGFKKEEMLSLKFQDIDNQRNDKEKWMSFVDHLKNNGNIIREYDFLNNDGKRQPVEEHSQYSEISGSGYVIIIFQNVSERKKEETRTKKNAEQQKNLSDISYLFNTKNDFDYKVREALRMAGYFKNVSRAFIFENILSSRAVSNTYEWCNDGVESQIYNLQAIPYTMFPSWMEIMNSKGYIEASELTSLPEDIISVFKMQQVISLIAFPLIIDNKYNGFVGFSEGKKKHKWEKNEKEYLKTLSVIISNAYEQKITLDSLKKSERRFHEFADLLPDMVCEMNINGKIIFANTLASEKFGITKERLQQGTIFYSFFIEADRLKIFEYFESRIKGEKIINEIYRVETIDGKEIPVIIYVDLIMRDKMPIGLRSVLVNISEKIKVEQQLSFMSKIIEESPFPLICVEKEGSISYCSKKGKIIKDFIENSYTTYFKDLIDVLFKTGRNEELEINIAGNYFRLKLVPSSDENQLKIYGEDITQKKIDEEKARLNEQRFQDIAEAAIEYIWETDINYHIKYISDKIKMVLGYESDELIGQTFFNLMPADEEKRVRKIFKDYSQKGEYFFNTEFKILKKDRTQAWQALSGIPVFNFERKIIGFRGTGLDITQQKKSEEDLNESKLLTEKALKIKAEFLGNISHEIRTPMNAILGLTHILMQEYPIDKQSEYLKHLKLSAENLHSLINDILDYSKIEAGKIVFDEIDFNLEELIKNIGTIFTPRIEEKNIQFELKVDSQIPKYLCGDTVRLVQIIGNLLSNAIKFTEEGKIKLKLSLLTKQKEHADVLFEVYDTGIGIAPEAFKQIFDSFTQVNNDTTRKYGGVGLGLAISKKLIEMQGGKIEVESEPGKGSKFSFYLRFKISNQKTINILEPILNGQFESLKNLRILVVEDNLLNQLVARKYLEKWEAQFDIVDDGLKAYNLVKERDFDIILMDIQMPVMDGYEATRMIRQIPGKKYENVPIIALTASILLEIHKKITDSGMNDFLIKPFNPNDLYSKIRKFALNK
jgi:PAS domain S-box-containing protein